MVEEQDYGFGYFSTGYYENTVNKPSSKYASTVEFFREHGVTRVLDLGCGVGRHAIPLARDRFKVYGFDYSISAVRTARKLLRENSLKANLIVHDMSEKSFPYKDSFFDAVVASRTVYQAKVREISRRLREVRRVLRDGGYFFWEGPTYKTTFKNSPGEKHRKVEPGTVVGIGGPFSGEYYHRFRSKKELTSILKGFRVIRMDFHGKDFSVLCQKT